MIALAPALLFAVALAPGVSLDAAVSAIYRPYHRQADATPAWERPIWSAEVRALIARWRRVTPADEVDDLSDGDWLCLCQDWDERAFRATIRSRRLLSARRARVEVRIDLGFGQARQATLLLVRAGGGWKVDDLVAGDFPRGLRQALRETIAADSRR